MRVLSISFFSGALFAVGLVLSGMTTTAKVTGFLDVTGQWDPSLAFVMVGGIGVNAVLYRLARRRGAPLVGQFFRVSPKLDIDARLLVGSGLFGVGWGLFGACPGPSIVAAMSGASSMLLFVGAMFAGFFVFSRVVDEPFDC